jgi:hypothetical protein
MLVKAQFTAPALHQRAICPGAIGINEIAYPATPSAALPLALFLAAFALAALSALRASTARSHSRGPRQVSSRSAQSQPRQQVATVGVAV